MEIGNHLKIPITNIDIYNIYMSFVKIVKYYLSIFITNEDPILNAIVFFYKNFA